MTYRAASPPGVGELMGDPISPECCCPVPIPPVAPPVPPVSVPPQPRLGLALSCGGARGLAHIGVIQVLEENGIRVDAVAGSSMGAYIAAIWGFGHNGAELEALARQNEGRFGLRRLMDPVFPPRQGFLRGDKIRRHLEETIGHRHFHEMVRPARVIATDLQTLDRVVFDSGEVARAVQASIAIPGVCVPVTIGDRTYIDGGISDPLPVDVLRGMGLDRIIAVNTLAPPSFLRCCEEHDREQAALSGRRPGLLGSIGRKLNYFAPGNILDTMMRAVHGAQIRVAEAACREADFVLRPLSMESSWIEFHHPRKYIELGRRVALENLPAIQALLTGAPSEHEHLPAPRALGAAV